MYPPTLRWIFGLLHIYFPKMRLAISGRSVKLFLINWF